MKSDFKEINLIDCSAEEGEPLANRPAGLQWIAQGIQESDWRIPFSDNAAEELNRLVGFIEANPVDHYQRRVEDMHLPELSAAMADMKRRLDKGPGFAVLDHLPLDDYAPQTMLEVYWLLGQMIGRPVAQKWNGQMIYNVKDTGRQYSYGVRGSHTSVELVFHTDNAFARAVPDYVGLLCVQPAKSGGISRFCSLYTVHDRLHRQYPKALERLYKSMLFDRQKEHAEGAPPVCLAPFFSWKGGRLFARANTSLVHKGYEVAGVQMDTELEDALSAVDHVCTSEDIWYEAPLVRGQVQFLNNHEIGHYRSAFEDFDEPERKRHLYRMWIREEGSVCYDGVLG